MYGELEKNVEREKCKISLRYIFFKIKVVHFSFIFFFNIISLRFMRLDINSTSETLLETFSILYLGLYPRVEESLFEETLFGRSWKIRLAAFER